jgi:hypothetical protein
MSQYEIDLEECSNFSEDISTGKSIAKGAATGAAIGAVVEVVTDEKEAIEKGAVAGGAKSGIRAVREKEQILKRCLRGRGYKVLN